MSAPAPAAAAAAAAAVAAAAAAAESVAGEAPGRCRAKAAVVASLAAAEAWHNGHFRFHSRSPRQRDRSLRRSAPVAAVVRSYRNPRQDTVPRIGSTSCSASREGDGSGSYRGGLCRILIGEGYLHAGEVGGGIVTVGLVETEDREERVEVNMRGWQSLGEADGDCSFHGCGMGALTNQVGGAAAPLFLLWRTLTNYSCIPHSHSSDTPLSTIGEFSTQTRTFLI